MALIRDIYSHIWMNLATVLIAGSGLTSFLTDFYMPM